MSVAGFMAQQKKKNIMYIGRNVIRRFHGAAENKKNKK
jgi:hypothetical protein